MCQVGVSNEGRSSSMVIGLSNNGKWVMKEAFSAPLCLPVVHLG